MDSLLLVSFAPAHAVLRLAGEFDLVGRAKLVRRIDDAITLGCARLEVHCAEVTFIDCGSLRELAAAKRLMEQRGSSLLVTAPSPAFARAARLAGFDQLLTCDDGSGALVPGEQPTAVSLSRPAAPVRVARVDAHQPGTGPGA